jgi:uncharacterized protein (DUF1501 family)
MNPFKQAVSSLNRRAFLQGSASTLGTAALAGLFARDGHAASTGVAPTHFSPRAKRVIYLFQSGGPSHIDLLDYKPELKKHHGSELPDSIRQGQRLTGMTSGQKSFPVIASKFGFHQAGQSGVFVSNLLPYTSRVIDEICMIRSMHTEAINHDPAITFIQTGSQQPGRPSLGAWLSYGLGSESEDLPAFVVLISHGSGKDANQGLLERLWGSGFLASSHQGVKFRSSGDAVLYLSDPPGIDRSLRRTMLDSLSQLNSQQLAETGDPEIATRIGQYEMAFRMQASVPELTDLSHEPASTFDLYGDEAKKPGTFAANCLLARRMIERGVRCVQLYHRGWDQHGGLATNLPKQAHDIDQPQAALIMDLKQRGMLDDTLIVWAGEFGRTVYGQGGLLDDYGRDHHGRCYSVWLAGGGIQPGMVYGKTDEFGYNIVENPVHIHDLNATILHCLGYDHTRLTFRFQGRDYRLTDVHGNTIKEILSQKS